MGLGQDLGAIPSQRRNSEIAHSLVWFALCSPPNDFRITSNAVIQFSPHIFAMSILKTLRPLQILGTPHHLSHQRRTFLSNFTSAFNPLSASPSYQTLTASRTLPYATHPVYTIVADITSYSSFLPYCLSSTITKHSAPDTQYHTRWPSEAEIIVGYGSLTESFTSRIFCVPGRIVESVGGGTETELDSEDIAHHLVNNSRGRHGDRKGIGLLTHLRSRWTLEPLEKEGASEQTKVTLSLEYAFANPLYSTLSAGAAPRVAELMIKAFEERMRTLLDGDTERANASLGDRSIR